MMKKLFVLLLLLCCLCIMPALAENDVWGLYTLSGNQEYLLGTATPCGEGMLLSVDGIVADGMTLYAVRHGEKVQISHAAGLENGMLVLYADGIHGDMPAASAKNGNTVYITSVTGTGIISAEGKVTGDVTWKDQPCMLVNCAAELTVGASVTDKTGALTGIVAAVWGEGINHYVVLPAAPVIELLSAGVDENSAVIYDGVSDFLNGLYEEQEVTVDPRWVREFTVDAEGTKITVNWEAAQHTAGEDEKYFVLFMDLQNPFYSYMEVENSKNSILFYAAPERSYAVWVQCCTKENFISDVDISTMKWVTAEAAVPFADYAYRDNELYLGIVPAGSEENSVKAEKLDRITVADILDDETDFCLQAVSQYEVTEETAVTMQTVLTTPEGYAFTMDSAYYFIPEIQESDVWNATLESIFANYQQFSGFISTGEYSLAYYFDGQLAGSLTFTIE